MYAIYIRGRKEPFLADVLVGKRIKESWAAGGKGVVNLNEGSFEMESIKMVESSYKPDKTEERNSDRLDKSVASMNTEMYSYTNAWRARVKLSPTQKARNMQIPLMIWFAYTGAKDIPLKARWGIYQSQKKFFEENSRLIWANPQCYRHILPPELEPPESKMLSIARANRDHALRFVENLLNADYRESKYNSA